MPRSFGISPSPAVTEPLDPGPSPAASPLQARFTRMDALVLAAIVALGLVNLPQPFAWDQAMFAIGARKLAHGAVLYRDYWDPKQPAPFAFYALAGTLFGFTEVGIHLFELLYLAAFAAVLTVTLKGYFRHSWAAPLAALFTVGFFYAVTEDWHLTQIEGLVGFPMFLALWRATRAASGADGAPASRPAPELRSLFVSGLAGGICLLSKFLFLPILACFWLSSLAAIVVRARPRGALAAARGAGAIALGTMVPLLAASAYFAAHRAFRLAWWTSFDFPVEVMRQVHGFRFRPFLDGLSWFAERWSPVLGLAAIGVTLSLRARRDLFSAGLLLWCVAGVAVLLVQRLSFWQYQYLILTVPLGILAARGVDLAWPALARIGPPYSARDAGVAASLGLAFFFTSAWVPLSVKCASLAHDRLALSRAGRLGFQNRLSKGGGYPKIRAEAAFLSGPGSLPGPIFVVGNPLYYWLSGRDQAVARNGASFIEYATEEEWSELTASLDRARPAYIFIQGDYDRMFASQATKCASFLDLLARDYRPRRRTAAGTWYERSATGGGAAPAGTPAPGAQPAAARAPGAGR